MLRVPFQLTWTCRATYIKGDPYIRDMKHTRSIIHIILRRLSPFSLIVPYSGHVSELTSCSWHPKNSEVFITSSADSTIRWVLSLVVSNVPSFFPLPLPHLPIHCARQLFPFNCSLAMTTIPPKFWDPDSACRTLIPPPAGVTTDRRR